MPFPYATYLNVFFQHLQRIDVPQLVDSVTDQWFNQTLCQVNGSVVRRTRAPQECAILMAENAGIIPTGD